MKLFWFFPLLILVLIVTSGNGCVFTINGASEEFVRKVELSESFSPGSKLSAETSNGAIIVTGTGDEQCRIVAAIIAKSFSLEQAQTLAEQTQIRLESTPQGLRTVIDRPDTKSGESVNVSYDIQVPRRTILDLRTSNGTITTVQIEQAIRASTSNGKIDITSASGNVTARTSNGAITIRNAALESLDLQTSNGSIKCENIAGSLNASTSNGSVNIQYAPDANTPADIRITTSNGGIDLVTPQNYSAKIDAATTNGKIHASLPVEGQQDAKRTKGTIRQGDGQLYLRTTNSSIHIN